MTKLPILKIIRKHSEINSALANTSEMGEIIKLGRELKKITPQFDLAAKILKLENNIEDNNALISGGDAVGMENELEGEISENKIEIESLETELLVYLTPEDPRDDKDIFLEIRAGAGGDESSIFAGELVRTYSAMAVEKGFSVSIVDFNNGTVGGYKDVTLEIKGDGAFSWFKYEGGVHRVQRVPQTEKQGRVHTSTISVAIMPVVEENSSFKLDLNEVEIIATTSQGAGGQSVNTTYSAVQMHHKPTGVRAQCQDERNFQQNKIKCMQMLTSRVYDILEKDRIEKEEKERKDQVGTADRSEKIRTYNFPQDRLTDHRYNTNWNQLPDVMNGGISRVIGDIKKLEAENNIKNLNEKE